METRAGGVGVCRQAGRGPSQAPNPGPHGSPRRPLPAASCAGERPRTSARTHRPGSACLVAILTAIRGAAGAPRSPPPAYFSAGFSGGVGGASRTLMRTNLPSVMVAATRSPTLRSSNLAFASPRMVVLSSTVTD